MKHPFHSVHIQPCHFVSFCILDRYVVVVVFKILAFDRSLLSETLSDRPLKLRRIRRRCEIILHIWAMWRIVIGVVRREKKKKKQSYFGFPTEKPHKTGV